MFERVKLYRRIKRRGRVESGDERGDIFFFFVRGKGNRKYGDLNVERIGESSALKVHYRPVRRTEEGKRTEGRWKGEYNERISTLLTCWLSPPQFYYTIEILRKILLIFSKKFFPEGKSNFLSLDESTKTRSPPPSFKDRKISFPW